MTDSESPPAAATDEKLIDGKLSTLGLVRKLMPKDGACLFRAVAEQVLSDPANHKLIREECVKYLEQNRPEFAPFVAENYGKYCKKMRKPTTWGGELELQAISRRFRAKIEIHSTSQPPRVIGKDGVLLVRLAYTSGDHFDSVFSHETMQSMKDCQALVLEVIDAALRRVPGSEGSQQQQNWKQPEYRNLELDRWMASKHEREEKDMNYARLVQEQWRQEETQPIPIASPDDFPAITTKDRPPSVTTVPSVWAAGVPKAILLSSDSRPRGDQRQGRSSSVASAKDLDKRSSSVASPTPEVKLVAGPSFGPTPAEAMQLKEEKLHAARATEVGGTRSAWSAPKDWSQTFSAGSPSRPTSSHSQEEPSSQQTQPAAGMDSRPGRPDVPGHLPAPESVQHLESLMPWLSSASKPIPTTTATTDSTSRFTPHHIEEVAQVDEHDILAERFGRAFAGQPRTNGPHPASQAKLQPIQPLSHSPPTASHPLSQQHPPSQNSHPLLSPLHTPLFSAKPLQPHALPSSLVSLASSTDTSLFLTDATRLQPLQLASRHQQISSPLALTSPLPLHGSPTSNPHLLLHPHHDVDSLPTHDREEQRQQLMISQMLCDVLSDSSPPSSDTDSYTPHIPAEISAITPRPMVPNGPPLSQPLTSGPDLSSAVDSTVGSPRPASSPLMTGGGPSSSPVRMDSHGHLYGHHGSAHKQIAEETLAMTGMSFLFTPNARNVPSKVLALHPQTQPSSSPPHTNSTPNTSTADQARGTPTSPISSPPRAAVIQQSPVLLPMPIPVSHSGPISMAVLPSRAATSAASRPPVAPGSSLRSDAPEFTPTSAPSSSLHPRTLSSQPTPVPTPPSAPLLLPRTTSLPAAPKSFYVVPPPTYTVAPPTHSPPSISADVQLPGHVLVPIPGDDPSKQTQFHGAKAPPDQPVVQRTVILTRSMTTPGSTVPGAPVVQPHHPQVQTHKGLRGSVSASPPWSKLPNQTTPLPVPSANVALSAAGTPKVRPNGGNGVALPLSAASAPPKAAAPLQVQLPQGVSGSAPGSNGGDEDGTNGVSPGSGSGEGNLRSGRMDRSRMVPQGREESRVDRPRGRARGLQSEHYYKYKAKDKTGGGGSQPAGPTAAAKSPPLGSRNDGDVQPNESTMEGGGGGALAGNDPSAALPQGAEALQARRPSDVTITFGSTGRSRRKGTNARGAGGPSASAAPRAGVRPPVSNR